MAFEQIKVELCDWWGKDENIAHQAWASTYDLEKLAQKSDADVRRVVSDVVSLHHGTPKERLWMDFFITCPIFVERQFDKYRMTIQYQGIDVEFLFADMGRDNLTQNELSGRYRTIPDRPLVLPDDVAEIMAKSVACRRNVVRDEPYLPSSAIRDFANQLGHQQAWYQAVLGELKYARDVAKTISAAEFKRAREVVRGVLGTAFLTDMRILCNFHSFEHVIDQRLAPEAQFESRIVAGRMVLAAENAGMAPTALATARAENGWDEWLLELRRFL